MNRSQLAHFMKLSEDPEATLTAASTDDLGIIVDALYRNLDTPKPVFGAQDWYDLATEELARRTSSAASDSYGAASSPDAYGAA
ncbi:hypothetical protein B1A87_016370 [Arthrobacter sp. KBS0703]|jgi:hypothetical protein|uniref:hypothetical protein n=1 Tax=Bacteria TaxID=2 RepID=UPI0009C47D11|nr:hypothetical protein [Arthrobacter sp. KBS0703]TSE17140.1 hypothetical protein B1A87_016370 [Arthrobacter sp. KBS0703]